MRDRDETDRTLGDLVRYGTIASVDLAAARCTVKCGDLLTGPIPWLTRAGAGVRDWSPPSVGEQVSLLCADGEIASGLVLGGLPSTAHPAPAADAAYSTHFSDGAVIRYDPAVHALTAVLPTGGTIDVTAPGGVTITTDESVTLNATDVVINADVTINGDVAVNGEIDASGDVFGQGTSLHTHKHLQVKTGTDVSGVPQ